MLAKYTYFDENSDNEVEGLFDLSLKNETCQIFCHCSFVELSNPSEKVKHETEIYFGAGFFHYDDVNDKHGSARL
jgi:hypothetical protein